MYLYLLFISRQFRSVPNLHQTLILLSHVMITWPFIYPAIRCRALSHDVIHILPWRHTHGVTSQLAFSRVTDIYSDCVSEKGWRHSVTVMTFDQRQWATPFVDDVTSYWRYVSRRNPPSSQWRHTSCYTIYPPVLSHHSSFNLELVTILWFVIMNLYFSELFRYKTFLDLYEIHSSGNYVLSQKRTIVCAHFVCAQPLDSSTRLSEYPATRLMDWVGYEFTLGNGVVQVISSSIFRILVNVNHVKIVNFSKI